MFQFPHNLRPSAVEGSDASILPLRLQHWQQLHILRAVDVALVHSLWQLRQLPPQHMPAILQREPTQQLWQTANLPDELIHQPKAESARRPQDVRADTERWSWLALASAQVAQGHLCLDLPAVLADPGLLLASTSRYGAALAELQRFVASQHGFATDVMALFRCMPDVVQVIDEVDAAYKNVATASDAQANANGMTPFVLWQQRLYLRRYFVAEQRIANSLRQRCQLSLSGTLAANSKAEAGFLAIDPAISTTPQSTASPVLASHAMDVVMDETHTSNLQNALRPWFQLGGELNWQLQACAMALTQAFTVITGGPGTGKTTTVVKLLLALQWLQLQQQRPPLQIALAAPTGKAAARLGSSISHALQREATKADFLPLLETIPSRPVTLHRLLGISGGMSAAKFDTYRPLALDVLVVDEASMIDAELFMQLLQALPAQARLIILGDKDQLASVEAGAVLAELCHHATEGGYSSALAARLAAITSQRIPLELQSSMPSLLAQHVVMLRHSHRFAGDSGIGRLANAINEGHTAAVQKLLLQPPPDLRWLMQSASGAAWHSLLAQGYQPLLSLLAKAPALATGYVASDRADHVTENDQQLRDISSAKQHEQHHQVYQDQWAATILAQLSAFQILVALRQGAFGVEALNQQIAHWLQGYAKLDSHETWYHGRVVMVTQNDYSTGLMNGDIGICLWYSPQRPLALRSQPVESTAVVATEVVQGTPAVSSGADRSVSGRPVSGQSDMINHSAEAHEHRQAPMLRVAFLDEQGQVRWFSPARVPPVETAFAMTVHKSQGSEFEHAVFILPDYASPVLNRELLYTAVTRAAKQFTLIAPQWSVLRQAIGQKTQRRGGLRLAL